MGIRRAEAPYHHCRHLSHSSPTATPYCFQLAVQWVGPKWGVAQGMAMLLQSSGEEAMAALTKGGPPLPQGLSFVSPLLWPGS